MSYYSGWVLANDQDFMARIGFCSEVEGFGYDWGIDNRMAIAASPGFSDAYESAVISEVPNPGRDPAVISDAQILSAVQSISATP